MKKILIFLILLSTTVFSAVNVEKNDINNENANMSSMTPAGQMMRFASEVSKIYALENLVSEKYKAAHNKGEIHIHDLDYYPSKTTTCLQYDLADMFEKGFHTKHGFIREAKSITTYATLATIIFQTNQNEQHGGQSIPAFDFYMAKGVLKSFRRHFRYRILSFLSLDYVDETNRKVKGFINENINNPQKVFIELKRNNLTLDEVAYILDTDKDTVDQYFKKAGLVYDEKYIRKLSGSSCFFEEFPYWSDRISLYTGG